MGLFSKKQKIDYDMVFKEQYKSINQLMMQAQDEHDYMIKASLLAVVVEKYHELITLIDQGAHYDKAHFESLQESAQKELDMVQDIVKEDV